MIHVRRLGIDDWEANRDIRLQALAEFPGNYFTSLAEAEKRTEADWRAMLTDPKMAIFGLFDGEALAGLTAAYIDDEDPTGATAGLAMSYLRPGWRGHGLSARLFPPRLDWARERGCTRVTVSHRASNTPSMRGILRHGFALAGKEFHLWPDGEEEENYRYVLML